MSSELQAEIGSMTKGQLRTKAKELNVSQRDIDDAGQEDDEKAALTDLILKNAPASPAELLMKMTKGQLRTKAKEAGISQDDIDAVGEEDEKAALSNLIITAPKKTVPEPEPEPEPEGTPALEPVVTAAYQLSGGGLTKQKSIHTRNAGGSPQVRKIEMGGSQIKLLNLVNEVQEISLGDLDMSDAQSGSTLEWPQICVVGGQAEGKSTLLSAIVSANMTAKMNFLPEGIDMVTRCPILVQMTCPKGQMEHTAVVSTQRHGSSEEEGVPGQGGLIPGPGAVPTATEIKSWGLHIQHSITALQDSIVAKNEVTHQKIIVKLKGPCLPNLSLVDLPGLQAGTEPGTLPARLREMVTANLLSPSAIILSVGSAGNDPKIWAGKALAEAVDQQQIRTIGVVTKVDTLFGRPATQLQLANQEQLKRVLLEEEDTPYYAAYNPAPEDEQAFLDFGINLKNEMEAMFRQGHVGNQAIAKDLEGKLAEHLEVQLPALHKRFRDELDKLNAVLSTTAKPSWTVVEQLMLAYSRHVSHYVVKTSNPREVKPSTGISDPKNAAVQAGLWDNKASIKTALTKLVDSFNQKMQPQAIYEDPGAADSVLFMDTRELLSKIEESKSPGLDVIALVGPAKAKLPQYQRDDSQVAVEMGVELGDRLSSLCGDVLGDIGHELKTLLKRYYRAVATVQFELTA